MAGVEEKHIRTLRDFFKSLIQRIKDYKVKASNEELNGVVKALDDALRNPTVAKKEAASNTEVRQSIVTLKNGLRLIKADRQVISGTNQNKWKEQITKYINDIIRKGKDLNISTIEGDTLTITENTAGKAAYWNKGLSERGFITKLNAEAHIDELAQISVSQKDKDGNKKIKPDMKNHDFAKDGFSYRTAYFEDFDGQRYRIEMSVGINGAIESVYNIGRIIKKALTDDHKGLRPQRAVSASTVGQSIKLDTVPTSTYYAQENEKVNTFDEKNSKNRNSLDIDSEGNTLSKQQQEYFKDSKVRDKDGNLLVVYHGTDMEFTIFDYEHIGDDNKLGLGFYFTNGQKLQYSHENVVEAYINIVNPLTDNNPDFDTILNEQEELLEKGKTKKEILGYIQKKYGYDGIIHKDRGAVVAFTPEQIKLTTNTKPTIDEDIRYSHAKN